MRIEGTSEGAGSGGTSNQTVQVKVEPPATDAPSVEVKQEPISDASSNTTTPDEEQAKPITGPYTTRGVKVRYSDDAVADPDDDDFAPSGNSKKKRRTSNRKTKLQLPDIGGYRPTKKRVNRKDPTRCHVCRQRFDDPNLKYFPGPPADALEEIIALTDPSLSLFTGDEENMSEHDQRPILKLTQFGIYDEPGHLCHLDGGAIEANHLLYAYGYVKAVWNDNPGVEGGIATKEIGPINEWFISGFDGGEKAIMCNLHYFFFLFKCN